MMTKSKIYIDSCCVINYCKGETRSNLTEDEKKDVWFIKRMFLAKFHNDVEIFTSALTIAECLYTDKMTFSATDEEKEIFNRVLLSGRIALSYPVDHLIALKSRDIRWNNKINIRRGADGVHVATAVNLKCNELWTIDGKIAKDDARKKIFSQYGLAIINPSKTLCLPDEYKKLLLTDKIEEGIRDGKRKKAEAIQPV